MTKQLYTDAGYTWQNTETTPEGGIIKGRICVADSHGFHRIEVAGIGKVPILKQYINIFELTAIARAIEVAIEMGWVGSLRVTTDSKVAMIWASSGKVSQKVETEAHRNALEYLRTARKNYAGTVTYHHIGRDHNPAGKLLEKELEKDRAKRIEQAQSDQPEPINRGNITLDPLADVEV